MSAEAWIALVVAVLGFSGAFLGLWTKIHVTLKALEMRVAQLEGEKQEMRSDLKDLTKELNKLVVELAKLTDRSGGQNDPPAQISQN